MKRWEKGEGFVVIQAALLLLIAVSGRKKRASPSHLRFFGLGLVVSGTSLGLASGRTLGRNLTPLPQPVADGELVTLGAYAFVRHPIYTALLLLCTGFGLWRGNPVTIVLTALLGLLFDRKATFEETKLAAQYPDYPEYARQVGKFWPALKRE